MALCRQTCFRSFGLMTLFCSGNKVGNRLFIDLTGVKWHRLVNQTDGLASAVEPHRWAQVGLGLLEIN